MANKKAKTTKQSATIHAKAAPPAKAKSAVPRADISKASAAKPAPPAARPTTALKSATPPVTAPPPEKERGKEKSFMVVSPRTLQVAFVLHAPEAKRVSLGGEFNAWSTEANPLTLQDRGQWKTVLNLRPGRYQYKFVVDGEWVHDPQARENVANPHGSLNSVVEVRAPAELPGNR